MKVEFIDEHFYVPIYIMKVIVIGLISLDFDNTNNNSVNTSIYYNPIFYSKEHLDDYKRKLIGKDAKMYPITALNTISSNRNDTDLCIINEPPVAFNSHLLADLFPNAVIQYNPTIVKPYESKYMKHFKSPIMSSYLRSTRVKHTGFYVLYTKYYGLSFTLPNVIGSLHKTHISSQFKVKSTTKQPTAIYNLADFEGASCLRNIMHTIYPYFLGNLIQQLTLHKNSPKVFSDPPSYFSSHNEHLQSLLKIASPATYHIPYSSTIKVGGINIGEQTISKHKDYDLCILHLLNVILGSNKEVEEQLHKNTYHILAQLNTGCNMLKKDGTGDLVLLTYLPINTAQVSIIDILRCLFAKVVIKNGYEFSPIPTVVIICIGMHRDFPRELLTVKDKYLMQIDQKKSDTYNYINSLYQSSKEIATFCRAKKLCGPNVASTGSSYMQIFAREMHNHGIMGGGSLKLAGLEINYLSELPESKTAVWFRKELQPNDVLQKMYKTQSVLDKNDNPIKYTSGVSPVEGYYLYKLILDNDINSVLEVGMAYGTSALYICQALHDKNMEGQSQQLTSIDPFQTTQWKSIGLQNIKRAGLTKYHKLIEKTSDVAMAEINTTFDMVFVGGMHLFDYTLVDIYYGCKLLKMHGIIVIDDILHRGVKQVIEYIDKNYTFMKRITDTVSKTTATYIKIKPDTRAWDFHVQF